MSNKEKPSPTSNIKAEHNMSVSLCYPIQRGNRKCAHWESFVNPALLHFTSNLISWPQSDSDSVGVLQEMCHPKLSAVPLFNFLPPVDHVAAELHSLTHSEHRGGSNIAAATHHNSNSACFSLITKNHMLFTLYYSQWVSRTSSSVVEF